MKKKTSLILSLCLFGVGIMLVVAGMFTNNYNDTHFNNNTYINGTNVGGYTVQKAQQVVAEKMNNELDDINIKIIYKDKVWQFDKSDFDTDTAVKDVVNTAFKTSKFGDKQTVKYIADKTGSFKTGFSSVFKNFDKKLNEIEAEINTEPKNAFVEFNPDNKNIFNVVEAESGVKLDKDKLVEDLEKNFLNTKDITIYASTTSIEPEIKAIYFDDKLNLQGSFTTSLKDSQEGRRHNVDLALKKLNGTVVKPNEIVSFNAITGPQTEEGGYKNAIVIFNGKFTNGIGGGICQASSTLYNAVVLANLQVEEVHKHTLPVKYVELSLDAMVSEGYADLIFKNNSENDIYIKSYVNGDDATVEIYGKSIPEDMTIKRVAEFVGNIPHNGDKIVPDTNGEYTDKVLYKGEYYRLKYPCEGYEAKAFKEYYKNGNLVDREQIRHEKYAPQDGIIIEGTQDLPEGFVLPEQTVEFIKPEAQQ